MTITNPKYLEYFQKDVLLLLTLFVMQEICKEREKSGLLLSDILIREIEEICTDDIDYCKDYYGLCDYIHTNIENISETLGLATLLGIEVRNAMTIVENTTSGLLKEFTSLKLNPDDTDYAFHMACVLGKAQEIKGIAERQLSTTGIFPVDLRLTENSSKIRELEEYIPEQIYILLEPIKGSCEKLSVMMDKYLANWSEDKIIDETGLLFSQQIVNFKNYLKDLEVINNSISLPRSTLTNNSFSVIKVLAYLSRKGIIKPMEWTNLPYWIIRFNASHFASAFYTGRTCSLDKLLFFETGEVEYRDMYARLSIGTKTYALLKVMHEERRTPFQLNNIVRQCNPLVLNSTRHFRGIKDVDDTILQIKRKLGVKTGEYFPIQKIIDGNIVRWIWKE